MIIDANWLLSGALSAAGVLTGQSANGAGNVISTNSVDYASLSLGTNQPGELGSGTPLLVVFNVLTAPTVGTTVRFQLVQADDAAITTNVQVLGQTDDIPIASLPINTLVPLQIDRSSPYPPRRYIAARYVNVGAIATFSVAATLVRDLGQVRNLYYRSGYSIA